MVALCPTHHTEVGKRKRQYAYDLKNNPVNKKQGKFRGLLGTDKEHNCLVVGGGTFVNVPTVLDYYGNQIVGYRIVDGQILISAFLPDTKFWPEIEIVDNDIVSRSGAFWDIEFKTNLVHFRKRKGKSFLKIDIRGEDALFFGSFDILGQSYSFTPEKMCIPNEITLGGTRMENLAIGIKIGSAGKRVYRPNYAQLNPGYKFHN